MYVCDVCMYVLCGYMAHLVIDQRVTVGAVDVPSEHGLDVIKANVSDFSPVVVCCFVVAAKQTSIVSRDPQQKYTLYV